jgi:hypothetical protein
MITFRLEYDDDQLDIMDKVNQALKPYGVEFRDDMQEHDGFSIFTLGNDDEWKQA